MAKMEGEKEMSEKKVTPDDFEVYSTEEVTCPYCGKEQSDSGEYSDDGEVDCGWCGLEFSFRRNVEVTYSSQAMCICKHSGSRHFGKDSGTECHKSHTEYFLEPDKDGNESKTATCGCKKFISVDTIKHAEQT